MQDYPELDPARFDALMKTRNGSSPTLWGLDRIGRFMGVSRDTARRLARDGWPIRRVGGRWFAYKRDLVEKMRGVAGE